MLNNALEHVIRLGLKKPGPVARSHMQQHSCLEIGHDIISAAILSLLLIQVGQLSFTDERMCTKYWLTA